MTNPVLFCIICCEHYKRLWPEELLSRPCSRWVFKPLILWKAERFLVTRPVWRSVNLYRRICSFASNPKIYSETLTGILYLVRCNWPSVSGLVFGPENPPLFLWKPPPPFLEHDRGWVWWWLYRLFICPCGQDSQAIPEISVSDPGCLSRIPDPDFYPSWIPDLESKNSNKREEWKKFVVILFFVAINFTKLCIILFLKWWRKKFGPIFKELKNFLPKKLSQSSQKYGFDIQDQGSEIWDLEETYFGSRILDLGVKKALDPGSATLLPEIMDFWA